MDFRPDFYLLKMLCRNMMIFTGKIQNKKMRKENFCTHIYFLPLNKEKLSYIRKSWRTMYCHHRQAVKRCFN